jgi:putative FmdB family regulatory protein
MPTYEYACRDCGEHVEVVQSFRDEALQVCGACGGRLRKVFSAAGIIFKGSGYYVTDSRTQPAEATSSRSKGEGTASEDGKADSGKTDSGKTSSDTPAESA